MKMNYIVAIAALVFLGSCNTGSNVATNGAAKDTITTESGLKYYYIKKGEGREVENGSQVSAYLELIVEDSVVWTTANPTDSLFTFYAGYDRLIKGFTEMVLLLKEGDEVCAIMPDSLAYGSEGSPNFVPPNATVIYNPMRIVSVSEPKLSLSDELYNSYNAKGMEAMIGVYDAATTTDADKYTTGIVEIFKLWEKFTIDEKHAEAADIATYFGEREKEIRLKFSAVLSWESNGDLKRAKDSLIALNAVMPNVPLVQQKLVELEQKLLDVAP